tara:strand:+ start:222 stop:1409 length:1188 start_codon:yes stop_codon:yes gene_type:complete
MLTTSKIITQLGKKKNILIPNKNGDFKVADGIKSKDELLRLTLRQLRQEASKLSVPLYSRKTKAVLVDLIVSYQKKIIQRPKAGTKELEVSQGQISTPESSLSSEVKTNLVFLPRDPEWAYVFWQISDKDREKAQSLGANKLCLRLYDVTGTQGDNFNQGTLREIAVDSYSTEWYLPIPVADRDYKVELGYRYGFSWMSLAFSSSSHIPSSHPSEQILDKFVPFNLDSPSETNEAILTSSENEDSGLHERLYQAATTYSKRSRIGSEEFMENTSFDEKPGLRNDSGAGIWASGLNDSGVGLRNKAFWLVADAELIVYGATEPSADLTIGGEKVPLASDGTFRLQVPFRDGSQNYDIKAKATNENGGQERSITMKFDRITPVDNTNPKNNAETEWF